MTCSVTVAEDCRITLPPAVVKAMQIKPGMTARFNFENNVVRNRTFITVSPKPAKNN